MEVPRRTFLVLCGGSLLGNFALPGADQLPAATPPVAIDLPPTKDDLARVCRLVGPAQWDEGHRFMLWLEETDQGAEAMMWFPESAEEREEAERFYAAANRRTWSTYEELRALPPHPGPCVVRCVMQPRTSGYLITADEASLFSQDDEAAFLTNDPRKAATFHHPAALALIPRLMEHFGWKETSNVYFDTIPRNEAVRAYLLAANEG